MNAFTLKSATRIGTQFTLSAGAVIYSPILIVLLPKSVVAVRREQWWEVVVGILCRLR